MKLSWLVYVLIIALIFNNIYQRIRIYNLEQVCVATEAKADGR